MAREHVREISRYAGQIPLTQDALLLEGRLSEELGDSTDALNKWGESSRQNPKTKTAMHALISAGDLTFKLDRYEEADRYYGKAIQIANALSINADFLYYRAAWAAYRGGQTELALSASRSLLASTSFVDDEVLADATQIAGEALFEIGEIKRVKTFLSDKKVSDMAGSVLVETIKQYLAVEALSPALELADFGAQSFSLDRAFPELLTLAAGTSRRLKDKNAEMANLAKLSSVLPRDSLWRTKMRTDNRLEYVVAMEPVALSACEEASAHYYQAALKSGNPSDYLRVAQLIATILPFVEAQDRKVFYEIRFANSQFFAQNFEKADEAYQKLIETSELSKSDLRQSLYQSSKTKYALLQIAMGKVASPSGDRLDKKVADAFQQLLSSVEWFNNKFTDSEEGAELLLLAAGASRDLNDWQRADGYWRRLLVQKSSPRYRALAMRGTLAYALTKGDPEKVLDLCKGFLRGESWQTFDATFKDEILGILTSALEQFSALLKDKGKIIESGAVLVASALEFVDLNRREDLWRDGAYLLAVGNDWSSAGQAASSYFASGLNSYSADMNYLLARSKEHHIRFHDAAALYLKQANVFPKHKRSASSAERAEQLFLADDDFVGATEAARVHSKLDISRDIKRDALKRAYDYACRSDQFAKAKEIALNLRKSSLRLDEVLSSDLLLAKANYKTKNTRGLALRQLATLTNRIRRDRRKLDPAFFSSVLGEALTFLAEDKVTRFKEFPLEAGEQNLGNRIAGKAELYREFLGLSDQVLRVGQDQWIVRMRYLRGETAFAYAGELLTVLTSSNTSLSQKDQIKLNDLVSRLESTAKENHSNNALQSQRVRLSEDALEWVEKSRLALSSGKADDSLHTKKDRFFFPNSLGDMIPSSWKG